VEVIGVHALVTEQGWAYQGVKRKDRRIDPKAPRFWASSLAVGDARKIM
jgi:hypothetical protein